MKPSISIDSLGLNVPVEHSWPRKKRPARVEVESIHAQIHDDAVWLWDQGCNVQSDIYTFGRGLDRALWRPLADLPHIDAIYRYAAEQQISNRANLIGSHLQAAVRAMEDAIAARDGSSVYFAYTGGHVKIGFSKRVSGRLAQLQTACATPIQLLGTMPGGRAIERRIHAQFEHLRLDGEWFVAHPDLMTFIAESAGAVAKRRAEHQASTAATTEEIS